MKPYFEVEPESSVEQPELLIRASIEDIENVYHLARGGVEVEYQGMSGRRLALEAAFDLENLGHAEAPSWVNQIVVDAYEECLDQGTGPVSHMRAVHNARFLLDRGHPGALECLAYAYDVLTDDDSWESLAAKSQQTVPTKLEQAENALHDLQVNRATLDAGLALHNRMPHADIELWKPLDAYTLAMQAAVKLSPEVLIYGYEAISMYTHILIDRTNEDPTLTVLDALKSFIPYRYSKDIAIRTAALNALADLRVWYPDDRKVRREANAAAREDVFLHFGGREFDHEEYKAMERVRHGTKWDIMDAIDSWRAVQRADDEVRQMPSYMGSCALDAAKRK